MRVAIVFFGAATAAIVLSIGAMLWLAGAREWEDVPAVAVFSAYVSGPWIVAFVVAVRRPSHLRVSMMAGGAAIGAVVLGWAYYESIFRPTTSTSVLTLAVYPFFQWAALAITYIIIKTEERSPRH